MTLISHPGHWQQAAVACLDSGVALDIACMLADVRQVLDDLGDGRAPLAARQVGQILRDTDSPCTLQALASAVALAENMVRNAARDALAGIPGHIPGT